MSDYFDGYLVSPIAGATKCYKDRELGALGPPENTYWCGESTNTICCIKHEGPGCCSESYIIVLRDSCAIWGPFIAVIFGLALFVCVYRKCINPRKRYNNLDKLNLAQPFAEENEPDYETDILQIELNMKNGGGGLDKPMESPPPPYDDATSTIISGYSKVSKINRAFEKFERNHHDGMRKDDEDLEKGPARFNEGPTAEAVPMDDFEKVFWDGYMLDENDEVEVEDDEADQEDVDVKEEEGEEEEKEMEEEEKEGEEEGEGEGEEVGEEEVDEKDEQDENEEKEEPNIDGQNIEENQPEDNTAPSEKQNDEDVDDPNNDETPAVTEQQDEPPTANEQRDDDNDEEETEENIAVTEENKVRFNVDNTDTEA